MEQFCILTVENRLLSSKKEVSIDLGDESTLFKFDSAVITETQKATQFNSLLDALNHLGSIGWELAHVTPVRLVGGTSSGYEEMYLMKRKY